MAWWRRSLSDAELARRAAELDALDDPDEAWAVAAPLRAEATRPPAARTLARALHSFRRADAAALGAELWRLHRGDLELTIALGDAVQRVVDLDDLNRPRPDAPWLVELTDDLFAAVSAAGERAEPRLLSALASAAGELGRAGDEWAWRAHQLLARACPDERHAHYHRGLFCKTRGRWREGQAANQRALDLGASSTAVWWNLALCATGAGDGAAALAAWRHLGQRVELGRFGLPDGTYPMAHVRLAQRPLAERGADDDDPGVEENVWIERLSGGHGIVRVAVFSPELGVDYGDVIAFDGAPIGRHGDVPLFPHLATLRRQGYQRWPFAARCRADQDVGALSTRLPDDAVVYCHTDQIRILCRQCARGRGGGDHAHHDGPGQDADREDTRVVSGAICAPPSVPAAELLAALDRAAADDGIDLVAPELCARAGLTERARFEVRRHAALTT